MGGQAAGVQSGGIGGRQELRHEPGHAARRELTMAFTGENQVPMMRESLGGPFGGGGRCHGIGFSGE